MNKKQLIVAWVMIIIFLSGCATMFDDMRIAQLENQGKIYIGMSMTEVINIIGRQPNTISDIFKRENTSEGVYDTWVVNGHWQGQNFARTYTFKFKDGKLVAWSWQ